VTDLMVVPGIINLDFADVRTVMSEMGKAMMGTGEATGERRAVEAAEAAISNPLLDDVSLRGAKGVLINITGGKDLTLYEVDEAASLIRGQVDEYANIIVGSALDPDLEGIVRVSVVATGVDAIDGEIEDDRGNYPRYNAPVSTYEDDEVEAEEEPVAAFTPPPAPVRPTYSPSVASSAPAYAQHIQQPATAPQAPVQAPAPTPAPVAQAPAPAPAPIPEPVPAAAQQSVFRNTFGLWGRKKEQARQATPRQQQPASQPRPTGDLFGANVDDELEIPSFLRRQNK